MKWGRPFNPHAELVWVGASITGPEAEPLSLLTVYDTGTTRTLIERSVAERVGLHESMKIGDATLRAVAGPPLKGYRIIARQLEDFGRCMNDFEVVCIELSDDLEIDGLIGLDFVRGLSVTTDYRVGLITLED